VVIAAERNREPDHMISTSDMMFLHLVGTAANGATQLSWSPTGSKPNGPPGLLPGKSQIAPVAHQATNEE
jgi:hypothetical protein